MQNYHAAEQYIKLLTGTPDTIIDFRIIHDKEKGAQAHILRGTLTDKWEELCKYNNSGYGIFCNINAMDGNGWETINVSYIRTHVVDLDDPFTSHAGYQQALAGILKPVFTIQTSPGKYHIYWPVVPYAGNEFYTLHQRKLAQAYGGDRSIIDAARVMRVPGFYHLKKEPVLVGITQVNEYIPVNSGEIQTALAGVNVFDNHITRHQLGEPNLSAPSFEWVKYALNLLDPNDLSREEWLSISAAFKQAAWLHISENEILKVWEEWCALYKNNDKAENFKLWNSIRDTEIGWPAFERRTAVSAWLNFGFKDAPSSSSVRQQPPVPVNKEMPEILDVVDQQKYFENCYYIESQGKIFTASGRFMNASQFNGAYGGKHFIITTTGKITDEAFKAATRSTVWTIPKIDHTRFLPTEPSFKIINDNMSRAGLNTYIPAQIKTRQGDISPWLNHMAKILPVETDRNILFSYLAHCVKYPGIKIPWSVLLQSTEGIGKTIFMEIFERALGDMYVYSPKAPELIKSGSTFNAWMRNKLMIIVNEIKVDERRELIEILKPMITDARVEVQSKGVDQQMEDNVSNWLLFSNYKDAVPVNKNSRRYSIFYSALQNKADILNAGMDDAYFMQLWSWLRENNGFEIITDWLLNYPIGRGELPVRAPETSSHAETIRLSQSPLESLILNNIADENAGFKAGYVGVNAVLIKCKNASIRLPSERVVMGCLEAMGYVHLGRSTRAWFQEGLEKSEIYAVNSNFTIEGYGNAQGYI